jgi:hypothetical protein
VTRELISPHQTDVAREARNDGEVDAIDYNHHVKSIKIYGLLNNIMPAFTKAMLDKLGLTPAATTLQAVPPIPVRKFNFK